VILVGQVLKAEQFGDSYLYSPGRDRSGDGPAACAAGREGS